MTSLSGGTVFAAALPGMIERGEVVMSEAFRLLKKYPNRRLYDTHSSAYVTLDDVRKLVLEGERFRVIDARSGADLSHGILLQIICEEEASGVRLLSDEFLEQLIRSYGRNGAESLGGHLAASLRQFAEGQSTERAGDQPIP